MQPFDFFVNGTLPVKFSFTLNMKYDIYCILLFLGSVQRVLTTLSVRCPPSMNNLNGPIQRPLCLDHSQVVVSANFVSIAIPIRFNILTDWVQTPDFYRAVHE